MPEPTCVTLSKMAFVHLSHVGNRATQKSYMGFIIYLNRAPSYWYINNQKTVESNAFTSKFISLKVFIIMILGLRYKLGMFLFPLRYEGPAHVLFVNESVVNNFYRV